MYLSRLADILGAFVSSFIAAYIIDLFVERKDRELRNIFMFGDLLRRRTQGAGTNNGGEIVKNSIRKGFLCTFLIFS